MPELDLPVKIYPLHEKREYYPVLAHWSYNEWYTEREIPFELNMRAYAERARGGLSLPMAFIALAGTRPAGMVSLKENDLWARKDLNPWLASLFVDPPFRNRGTGRALVEAVESAALKAGYENIYLFLGRHEQQRLAAFYSSMNWRFSETAADNDCHPTSVFVKNLS